MDFNLVKNRSYPSFAKRWRGTLPFTTSEMAAGALVSLVGFFLGFPFIGGILGVVTISALVAWRKRDLDRSDYVSTYFRRRSNLRAFNACEPDRRYAPFKPHR